MNERESKNLSKRTEQDAETRGEGTAAWQGVEEARAEALPKKGGRKPKEPDGWTKLEGSKEEILEQLATIAGATPKKAPRGRPKKGTRPDTPPPDAEPYQGGNNADPIVDERQAKVDAFVREAQRNGRVPSSGDIRKLLGVSYPTAKKYLDQAIQALSLAALAAASARPEAATEAAAGARKKTRKPILKESGVAEAAVDAKDADAARESVRLARIVAAQMKAMTPRQEEEDLDLRPQVQLKANQLALQRALRKAEYDLDVARAWVLGATADGHYPELCWECNEAKAQGVPPRPALYDVGARGFEDVSKMAKVVSTLTAALDDVLKTNLAQAEAYFNFERMRTFMEDMNAAIDHICPELKSEFAKFMRGRAGMRGQTPST